MTLDFSPTINAFIQLIICTVTAATIAISIYCVTRKLPILVRFLLSGISAILWIIFYIKVLYPIFNLLLPR